MNGKDWPAALTGLAFVVLVVIGFAVAGEPPDPTDDSIEEVIDYYADDGPVFFGAALQALGAVALVFFGGYLRKVLTAASGEGHTLPSVVLAGTVILATGIGIDSTISFTLAETADEIAPEAVAALSALWNNDFMPMAIGMAVFLLSLGLSVVRHGGLPAWLGWIALVLGVIAVTPIGFAAFIGGSLLIAIASVMLTMRARAA